MKESKLKRNRFCSGCSKHIYGDAQKLREHSRLEKWTEEAAKRTGLLLPKPREIEVVNGNLK